MVLFKVFIISVSTVKLSRLPSYRLAPSAVDSQINAMSLATRELWWWDSTLLFSRLGLCFQCLSVRLFPPECLSQSLQFSVSGALWFLNSISKAACGLHLQQENKRNPANPLLVNPDCASFHRIRGWTIPKRASHGKASRIRTLGAKY